MLWYLSKRILRIPFVLLSISLLIFFISKQVPQDSVLNILELEGKMEHNNSDQGYSKGDYLQIAKELKLDLPRFYFSFRPSHYPKTRKIFPAEKRIEDEQLNQKKHFAFPVFQWNGLNNQYHYWVQNLIRGDFGISFIDGKQVSKKIQQAFQWTIGIVICSLLLSFILGIALGLFTKSSEHKKTTEFLGQNKRLRKIIDSANTCYKSPCSRLYQSSNGV